MFFKKREQVASTSAPHTMDPSSWPAAGENSTGEKAENLYRLTQNGFPVPPWFVITKEAHAAFMAPLSDAIQGALDGVDWGDIKATRRASEKAQALILTADFPSHVAQALAPKLDAFEGKGRYLAVRSSALGEDSKEHSFAGQLDSFLFVRGREKVLDSIRKCWASAYTDRALAYRHRVGADPTSVAMGVVVQQMVEGEVSGVAFTMNPVTEAFDRILISATHGCCEGVVSGELDTDQFEVDKASFGIIKTQTAHKKEQRLFDASRGGGTTLAPVPEELIVPPCLTEKQVTQLAEMFRRIEGLYRFPQDIEWTLEGETVHILQARPVTTINGSEYLEKTGVETIWDNSNIVESYAGITSPLTFSFIRNGYYMVYLQFCQVLKVPARTIAAEENNLKNMIGLLNGQVYYNLKNWYRLVSHLPGYHYNKSFMEQMMGVSEAARFDASTEKQVSAFKKYTVELPKLLLSGTSLLFQFLTMRPRVFFFMRRVTRSYETYHHTDFSSISAHGLMEIFLELEEKVLMHWKAPIVNDFLIMIFYGILQRLTIAWGGDKNGTLANDLLCGQGNVESTLPMKMLLTIAREIRQDPALHEIFREETVPALKKRILEAPSTSLSPAERHIKERLEAYIDAYGFRCMNELKLEEPSLKERPDFLFMMLKNYLGTDLDRPAMDESAIRDAAEETMRKRLKGTFVLKVIPRQFLFNRVLSFSKKGVAFREYQRFARTKMFGLVRCIFNAMGQKFTELGILEAPEEIFYLTTDEIFAFVEGTAVSQNIRGIAHLRQQEFAGFQDDLGQRIFTRGTVNHNTFAPEPEEPSAPPQDGDTLTGVSCCPGVVRGRVKVIRSPNDNMGLQNEILVAGKTDPGWVPLYPAATGVLIERGSLLSHSAIVAREMGLPAIVGISGLLSTLQTGDEVEMDGAAGTVKITKRMAG